MSSTDLELTRQQTEVLAEMGAHLRDKRLEAQLTIEQISSKTCITTRLLAAIEAGDRATLPETIYTQGLLSRFADAVGLDGRQYSAQFPTGINPTPRLQGGFKLPITQLRPLHLYFAYIALVIAAVTGISLSLDQVQRPNTELVEDEIKAPAIVDEQPTTPPAQTEPVAIPPELAIATKPTTTASPAPTPTTPGSPKPNNETAATPNPTQSPSPKLAAAQDGLVSIELTVTSESWLQVLADGEIAFEGTLSEAQKAWSADREITVVAGNAGAIMVKVNGGDQKELGEPGAVETVTFMADSSANTTAAQNPGAQN